MVKAGLRAFWHSPRIWTLGSAVLTRGVGFVASFSVSRLEGAERLALYMALVVTASSIVVPFAQIFSNGTTMALADAGIRRERSSFIRAQTWLVLCLAVVLSLVFAGLFGQEAMHAVRQFGSSPLWLAVVGLSLVVAPMLQALLTGALTGMSCQTPAARLVAVCCALLLPCSYPAVVLAGLSGAWCVLLLTLWLPVLGLCWMWQAQSEPGSHPVSAMLPQVWRLFVEGLPSGAALLVSGGLIWLCMIKLPQMYWGSSTVAVLAIAMQWLNLTLLPATTWSAIAMVDLAQARVSANPHQAVKSALSRWLMRNVLITAVVAMGVLAAMPWIEAAYRMPHNGLASVFVFSAAAALMMAAYGVIERLLMVLGRQRYLLWIALCGGLVQLAAAWLWAPWDRLGVLWAALLGATVVLGLGSVLIRRLFASQD